jgi:hypothetical protein
MTKEKDRTGECIVCGTSWNERKDFKCSYMGKRRRHKWTNPINSQNNHD